MFFSSSSQCCWRWFLDVLVIGYVCISFGFSVVVVVICCVYASACCYCCICVHQNYCYCAIINIGFSVDFFLC